MKGYVAGIGKINVDLIFGGLSRLPDEGEEIYGEDFGVYLGGGTPATLINCARLNVPTKLITYCGNDIFSEFAKRELEKNNCQAVFLNSGTKFPLNVTSVIITPEDRSFVTYREDAEGATVIDKETESLLSEAQIVIMQKANLPLFRKLKERGITLVMDTGFEESMNIPEYEPFLSTADYFLPNRKEALTLTGEADIESAAKRLSAYFKEVIIKLDKEGTYLYRDGKSAIIPPVKGIKQVDGTGAGDAFLAGFIYGLYNGYDTADSIKFGNITGGRCVTAKGCLTAYCTETELKELYNKEYGE